jgi:hypothetical protein
MPGTFSSPATYHTQFATLDVARPSTIEDLRAGFLQSARVLFDPTRHGVAGDGGQNLVVA